jgi:hypothetical protein
MRLDSARLCLDCEELHEDQVCPACGSEAFAFLTRWVQPSIEQPADRPAAPPRPAAPHSATAELREHPARTPEQIEAYRQLIEGRPPDGRRTGLLTKGVLGLAAFSLAGWAWRNASKARDARSGGPGPDDQRRNREP